MLRILCVFVLLLRTGIYGNLLRKQIRHDIEDSEKLIEAWKKLQTNVKGAVDALLKLAIPAFVRAQSELDLSDKCFVSLNRLIIDLRQFKRWPFAMIDATGKPASGYMTGTVSSFGSYDQCLDIEVPSFDGTTLDFRGQYCLTDFRYPMPSKPRYYNMIDPVPGLNNFTFKEEVLDEARRQAFINYIMSYRTGVCLPSTCTVEDVHSLSKLVGDYLGIQSEKPHCEVKEGFLPTPTQVGIMCSLLFLVCVVLISTIVDVYPRVLTCQSSDKPLMSPSFFRQFSRALSVNANIIRFTNSKSPDPCTDCLHGIKFISITWVIIGHTYLQINWYLVGNNEITRSEIMNPAFQVVLNANVAVDTFFLVTSFLMTTITIQTLETLKIRTLNVPIFVINRIWRLLPVMCAGIGMAILLPLFGKGPVWHETVDIVAENCRRNWWLTVLFVGNFVDPREACLTPLWYAMADMQMLFLALIFLLLVLWKPILGVSFAVIAVLLSCVVVGVTTYVQDSQPTILLITPDPDLVIEAWRNFHFMTYVHVAPYGIGLLAGYLYTRHKNFKIHPMIQGVLWLTSVASALLVVYGTSWWNMGKKWEPIETVLYAALHRVVWALALAWLILACCTGKGGVINRILSWSGFHPLSRMTYSVYVVHCLVIWYYVGSTRNTQEGQIVAVWTILGNLCVSFAFGFLCHLIIEVPSSQIFKVVASRIIKIPKGKESYEAAKVNLKGHSKVWRISNPQHVEQFEGTYRKNSNTVTVRL